MYLVQVKSTITQALKNVFTSTYPVADFADLTISIEFPMEEVDYPGIWIDFEPLGNLEKGGIDNYLGYAIYGQDGQADAFSRWRGQGFSTFTIGALTSLQRDRLFDEMVRVLAFNAESQVDSFRSYVESNPLVAMNMNFDNISIKGMATNPGTPWGTSEIIYEVTLSVETVIEFASDNTTQTLVPLAGIEIAPTGVPPVLIEPPAWGTGVWGQSQWSNV